MGGLVGIGFSFRINPTHNVQKFMSLSLHLELTDFV